MSNSPRALGAELAALLHEVNQPLTAILSNAQAAQRFLASNPPDLGELRNILTDIVADDKRAAFLIKQLGDLIKGDGAFAASNLHDGD